MWFDRGAWPAWVAWGALTVLLAAALLLVATASAWPRMHHPARGHRILQSGAPLDGFTQPSGAYSFRKLKSNYTGPAVKLRRVLDSVEADIGFTAAGDFDNSAATTFCSGTTCVVRRWYDQSGNARDMWQSFVTAGLHPLYVPNCTGSLPCLRTTDANMIVQTDANMVSATGIVALNAVGTKVSGTGGCFFVRQNGATGNRIAGQSAAQNWSANGGTSGSIVAPASWGPWHSGTAVFNGASSSLTIDNVTTAGTLVGSTTGGLASFGGSVTTTCDAGEVVIWDNYVMPPAQIAILGQNQHDYWAALPLDMLTQPSGAYGFRKLVSGYAGSAIRIRRASDSLEVDIGFVGFVPGTGSPVDVAAANTHCAATTCFGSKWYDQSGNVRDLVQATPANQPQLIFSCKGTLPCWQYTANTQVLQAAATITPASGTVSFSAVGQRSGGVGSFSLLAENGAAGNRVALSGTAATWGVFGGTSGSVTAATATEGSWHALGAVLAGAASVLGIDGTETTGTATGSVTAALPRITGPAAGTTANQVEAVFWDNYSLTATERALLVNNQRGFWGF